MIIQDPGQDIAYARKDASRSKIDAKIPRSRSGRGCQQDVAGCANQGHDDYCDTALLGPIGIPGGEDYEEEGDEIRGGGEALGVYGGETHFGEDGREEDGEGGEGDVAGEVH